MIRQLVVNNVLHRPIRTLVSVIAVGVEVALVILIVGLTSGLLQETAKRIEGIGADIMLQPPSASVFLAFSGAPMPIKIADKLREFRYVQAVAPVPLQFSSSGGVDVIYGIDPQSFRDVSGGFVFGAHFSQARIAVPRLRPGVLSCNSCSDQHGLARVVRGVAQPG